MSRWDELFGWAMIGVLLITVLVVIIALVDGVNRSAQGDKCALAGDSSACYQQRVEQCAADEHFTLQECLVIVGKSK